MEDINIRSDTTQGMRCILSIEDAARELIWCTKVNPVVRSGRGAEKGRKQDKESDESHRDARTYRFACENENERLRERWMRNVDRAAEVSAAAFGSSTSGDQ